VFLSVLEITINSIATCISQITCFAFMQCHVKIWKFEAH
jgi:hypothetical protein